MANAIATTRKLAHLTQYVSPPNVQVFHSFRVK